MFFLFNMESIWKCPDHGRHLEIICLKCNKYVCPMCLSTHDNDSHGANYIHVLKYATETTVPKIDQQIEAISTKDSDVNSEAKTLVDLLLGINAPLKEVVDAHMKTSAQAKTLVSQLDSYIGPVKMQPFADLMRRGLTGDKKRLEEALKNDNVETVIALTKKIIGEAEVTKKSNAEKIHIAKIKSSMASLSYMPHYKELSEVLKQVLLKCQFFKLVCCVADWKCDRSLLTTKLTLSDNCLVVGNAGQGGYPSIIGDKAISYGIMVYEVVPTGLCCTGKEGFGIIELDKFKAARTRDTTTPLSYDDMLGILHNNVVKNMTTITSGNLIMGSPYIVMINMSSNKATIKGPSVHLTADLKPGIEYVPVFSLGCSGNKMAIKPLEEIPEGIE